MDFETIVFDIQGSRATIRINRPERGNSFDAQTAQELLTAFETADKDENVRVVIFTGTGKCFCAGGDVKAMHQADKRGELPAFLEEVSLLINRVVFAMRSMRKPIIGRINGHAVGAGLGLVFGCDVLVAQKDAKLSAGFTGVGLAPGCSTYFLPRTMGYNRAAEFLFTRETIDACQAGELGLLNYVLDDGKALDGKVERIAKRIETGPAFSIGWCKELLNRSLENNMVNQMRLESSAIKSSGWTHDAKEGIAAFVEKRKPAFKGK